MKYMVFAIVLITGVVSVIISIALVPGSSEVALIRMRNREYVEALRLYEDMWDSGNQAVDVAMPLTQLYLQNGHVERAVEVMEQFVEADPNNLEACVQLGQYYQYAQRPNDYMRMLSAITRLQPTLDVLRELSASYNFTGEHSKQTATLKTLVELYPDDPQDFLDLAQLLAADQKYTEALDALDQMASRHPEAMVTSLVKMYVNLAIDARKPARVLPVVESWLERQRDATSLANFVAILRYRGFPAVAWQLVEPHEAWSDKSPALLVEFIRAQVAQGGRAAAFTKLLRFQEAERLPDELVPDMMGLALTFERIALVRELDPRLKPAEMHRWDRLPLIEAAVQGEQTWLVRKLTAADTPDQFTEHPLLGARVAVALGNHYAARQWMQAAQMSGTLSTADRVILSDLHATTQQPRTAIRLLEEIIRESPQQLDAIQLLVELRLGSRRLRGGVTFFSQLRQQHPSPNLDYAWAVLSAATGRSSRVLQELHAEQLAFSSNQMRDLFHTAADADQVDLALECARRLQAQDPRRRHVRLLAEALLAAQQPQEALTLARTLQPGVAEDRALYLEALQQSWRAGVAVRQELIDACLIQLEASASTTQQRQEIAYALVELHADVEALQLVEELANHDPAKWLATYVDVAARSSQVPRLLQFLGRQLAREELPLVVHEEALFALQEHGDVQQALPYLQEFATLLPGKWFFAYQEALQQLGHEDRLHELWITQAQRTDTAASEKRTIAFQLLEAGRKAEAEDIFLQLAESEDGAGENVDQLLHLWGPRPEADALEWMIRRATTASPSERPAWLQHLYYAGSCETVVALLESDSLDTPDSYQALRTHVLSLARIGSTERLQQLLRTAIASTHRVYELRQRAHLAREVGAEAEAVAAFAKLLEADPGDSQANRAVGRDAFFRGDRAKAKTHFEKRLQRYPLDSEVLFYYGEVLRGEGSLLAARQMYEQADAALQQQSTASLANEILAAHLAARMGDVQGAFERFGRLMQQHPEDPFLKADYASFLMDQRRFDDAAVLLSVTQEVAP